MNNRIEGLYSLEEIFNGRIFRIPDYQRGFSWKEDHVKALWEDLENLDEGKIHYTGMITVQKPSKTDLFRWSWEFVKSKITQNEFKVIENSVDVYQPLYIADGQQRMTTLILLLTAIRDSSKISNSDNIEKQFISYTEESQKVYRFGYEVDMPSYQYLTSQIFSNPKIELKEAETNYTENIRKAKIFFDEKLQSLKSYEVEILYEKIIRRLKFNFYEIPEQLDIFTIFETMNYRGKALSTLELLKNRLIYLIAISPIKDIDYKDLLRKKINESWTIVYQELAKNKENILNDDEYLRIHWLIYFNHDFKNAKDLQRYKQNLLERV